MPARVEPMVLNGMECILCSRCERVKLKEDFSTKGYRKDLSIRYEKECKGCKNKRTKKAYYNSSYRDEPLHKLKRKLKTLAKYKGMDADVYRSMMESQRNLCCICGVFFTHEDRKTSPHIDHDHTTGEVRGLLCSSCNVGIGNLQDSSEVCMRSATYLMSHGK